MAQVHEPAVRDHIRLARPGPPRNGRNRPGILRHRDFARLGPRIHDQIPAEDAVPAGGGGERGRDPGDREETERRSHDWNVQYNALTGSLTPVTLHCNRETVPSPAG